MNKGHYLDCIELLERNSRKSSYVKNQAEDLRRLVDEHYQLVEDHTKLERAYFGQQTTIRNLQETISNIRGYRERKDRDLRRQHDRR